MENQTRYGLNVAVEKWQRELAAQTDLTPEVRRELETHLRDAIAGFQRQGLSDEESFWLARRRVGQPQQLGEEFLKINPAKVWRERVVWFLVALLAIDLWRAFTNMLIGAIVPGRYASPHYYEHLSLQTVFPDWYLDLMPAWQGQIFQGLLDNLSLTNLIYALEQMVFFLPLAWLALAIARGRVATKLLPWRSLFESRSRFALAAITAILTLKMFQATFSALGTMKMIEGRILQGQSRFSIDGMIITDPTWAQFFWPAFLSVNSVIYPMLILVMIATLLPAQTQRALRSV